MPRYHVVSRIIKEWDAVYEAPDEQTARAMADAESMVGLGSDEYIESSARLLPKVCPVGPAKA